VSWKGISTSAISSTGFSRGSSQLSWNYDTNAGNKFAALNSFLSGNFSLEDVGGLEEGVFAETVASQF
jgi:hypothetical protein